MQNNSLSVIRETHETRIELELQPGPGERSIDTPLPVFSHFLDQFCFYWGHGITLTAGETGRSDDGHHLVEDTALALGIVLGRHLGDRSGLARFGQRWLPMDDALALAVVDVGGRPWCTQRIAFPTHTLPGLPAENIRHFFRSLALESKITLHLQGEGENTHHLAEALFKAAGLALCEAETPWRPGAVRSTKGVLS